MSSLQNVAKSGTVVFRRDQTLGSFVMQGKFISIGVAVGELIEKITILEIKAERLENAEKLANVHRELDILTTVRDRDIESSSQLIELTAELKLINVAIWEVEDQLRHCEQKKDFSEHFIELARSVYHNNDRRAELKRQINQLLGSYLVEEKSYVPYG